MNQIYAGRFLVDNKKRKENVTMLYLIALFVGCVINIMGLL